MTDSQKWLIFIGGLVCATLFYMLFRILAPVLMPFLVAALLAYLGDPLVDKLELKKLSRTLSVVIVFVVISLLIVIVLLVVVPLVERQLIALFQSLPVYLERFRTDVMPWLEHTLGINEQMLNLTGLRDTLKENWQQAGGYAALVLNSVSHSGMMFMAWLANGLLIPVVTFYLLRDWDHLIARIRELLPRSVEPEVTRLARESDTVLASFLRGQLLVMSCLSVIYSIGLWLVGLDLGILIGMIAGFVSFVPYLGFIVGFIMAAIAALMQFHDLVHLLPVLLVFGLGQAVEGMFLTPLLVGDRIGLHPVGVIFAVLVGGQLFGFTGVLLALPVAAVVAVLLRFAHQRYKASAIYHHKAGAQG